MNPRSLRHPLLDAYGIEHGFGVRDAVPPPNLVRPRQVHGTRVITAAECSRAGAPEADGVVSDEPGVPIAVVTADCVPILIATTCGTTVAAVHAGWRGLAAGVVAAGVAKAREVAGGSRPLLAVIGPCIGPCCYEVDAPVMEALRARFSGAVDECARPTRPGHAVVDLGHLTRFALVRAGLDPGAVARIHDACTRCDAERFHSYRRDRSAAGRLVHHIAARSPQA
jgi:hypothetical protein